MECLPRGEDLVRDWISSSCPQQLCRRAASFPIVHRGEPLGLLRCRSQSESTALNRLGASSCFKGLPTQAIQVITDEDGDPGSEDDASSGVGSVDSSPSPLLPAVSSLSPRSVRFADDCGRELFTIRVMTEPSDYPPRISPSVLRRLRGKSDEDDEDENAGECAGSSWVLAFTQPASDYMKFRETIDTKMVALENVVLKNETCRMMGTIKVKNISFEKRVFLRVTSDNWRSYMDYVAVYQPSSSKVYDTFSFDVPLPSNHDTGISRIEFCIGYSINHDNTAQFWDSNDGKNYALVGPESSEPMKMRPLFGRASLHEKYEDAYSLEHENWTRFASWKNLSNERPYW